jgi:hypothetical protein
VEHVAAEPADAGDAEGEVELEILFEPLLLRVGQDAVGERLGIGGREVGPLQPLEVSMHADLGRRARRQMQVGAVELHHFRQQFR